MVNNQKTVRAQAPLGWRWDRSCLDGACALIAVLHGGRRVLIVETAEAPQVLMEDTAQTPHVGRNVLEALFAEYDRLAAAGELL